MSKKEHNEYCTTRCTYDECYGAYVTEAMMRCAHELAAMREEKTENELRHTVHSKMQEGLLTMQLHLRKRCPQVDEDFSKMSAHTAARVGALIERRVYEERGYCLIGKEWVKAPDEVLLMMSNTYRKEALEKGVCTQQEFYKQFATRETMYWVGACMNISLLETLDGELNSPELENVWPCAPINERLMGLVCGQTTKMERDLVVKTAAKTLMNMVGYRWSDGGWQCPPRGAR